LVRIWICLARLRGGSHIAGASKTQPQAAGKARESLGNAGKICPNLSRDADHPTAHSPDHGGWPKKGWQSAPAAAKPRRCFVEADQRIGLNGSSPPTATGAQVRKQAQPRRIPEAARPARGRIAPGRRQVPALSRLGRATYRRAAGCLHTPHKYSHTCSGTWRSQPPNSPIWRRSPTRDFSRDTPFLLTGLASSCTSAPAMWRTDGSNTHV
jgi:hypothetical protein